MTKDDELASPCGRFVVDAKGRAQDFWLNAPYEFEGYDRWVVVRRPAWPATLALAARRPGDDAA